MSNSFATPWTIACQAPLSMGFPRQEYWSGWPLPSPGDLPDPGIGSPALAGGFFTTRSPRVSVSHCLESLTLQTLPRAFLPSHYHLPSNLPLPCISDYHLANSSDLTSLSPSPPWVSATPIPPPAGVQGVSGSRHTLLYCVSRLQM